MGVVATRISVSTATETKNRRHRTARYAIAVALMLMCLAALVLVPSFVPGAPLGWRSSTISIHDLKALRAGNPATLEGVVTFADPRAYPF